MARCDWPRGLSTLSFLLLIASSSTLASWSSSERSLSPELDDELIRDAPLYPPLQGLESLDDNPSTYDESSVPYEKQNTAEYDLAITNPLFVETQVTTKKDKSSEQNDVNNDELLNKNIVFDQIKSGENKKINIGEKIEKKPNYAGVKHEEFISKEVKDETEYETNVQTVVDVSGDDDIAKAEFRERKKRDSEQDWNKTKTNTPRVRTGDTILNIRGVVKDTIADGPRPLSPRPGPAAATRLDAVVIRPAAASLRPPLEQVPRDAKTTQTPRDSKELLVEAHARAQITCDLHNVTNIKWFKDGEAINLLWGSHSGEPMWRETSTKESEALIIARATRGDKATWRCTGLDAGGSVISGIPTELVIYEPIRAVYLSVDGRRLDAGNTWLPARDAAALPVRCHAEGGVPAPSLSWRLDALDVALDTRPYLRIQQTNYSIDGVSTSLVVVRAARELHNGTLMCTAEQRNPGGGLDETTAKLEIHVTYPPSFVISRYPGFGVALGAGGAAALRCDVDANPPARAWWMRDNAPSVSPAPPSADSTSATLKFPSLSPTHAGWYRCRATWMHQHYSSIGYYMNVHPVDYVEPQPPTPATPDEDLDHQKVDVRVGGNVQLHCPKGSVGCWWRKSDNSSSAGWTPAGSHYAHGVLGIKEALYQEGGEYRCIGAKDPDLARLKELKRVTLRVTGAATATAVSATAVSSGWFLECLACGRDVRVTWLRGSKGETGTLVPDKTRHCWRATLLLPHGDEVWCVAASPAGGAVAVFPPRAPGPARHAVRQQHDAAAAVSLTPTLVIVIAAYLCA